MFKKRKSKARKNREWSIAKTRYDESVLARRRKAKWWECDDDDMMVMTHENSGPPWN